MLVRAILQRVLENTGSKGGVAYAVMSLLQIDFRLGRLGRADLPRIFGTGRLKGQGRELGSVHKISWQKSAKKEGSMIW